MLCLEIEVGVEVNGCSVYGWVCVTPIAESLRGGQGGVVAPTRNRRGMKLHARHGGARQQSHIACCSMSYELKIHTALSCVIPRALSRLPPITPRFSDSYRSLRAIAMKRVDHFWMIFGCGYNNRATLRKRVLDASVCEAGATHYMWTKNYSRDKLSSDS